MKPGLLVIISSPSGGGKDTIINALLKRLPNAARLVTTTTRSPRPNEKNGLTYYFISVDEFQKRIVAHDFIEHNFYAGNFYGSEKKVLEKTLSNHEVVFTQIEVNGKHNLDKQKISNLSIFLMPENLSILRARIEKRGSIPPNLVEERLTIAKNEIESSKDYDFHVINYDGKLEQTITKIEEIIKERLTLDKKA